MGVFDRFKRWTLEGVQRPWDESPSIHAHLAAHTDPATGKLMEAGARLPDEPEQDPSQLRWAAGALDGVLGHHAGSDDQRLTSKQLQKALTDVLTQAKPEHLRHLYSLATRGTLLGVIDDVTDALRDNPRLQPERVHALGSLLAREAPRREAVKLGLALIGTIAGTDDSELLLQLGAHEELTLFAAVALVNQGGDEAEKLLFKLAQRVDGWGRIQIVERLGETHDPEIRAWLLREGFRNSVMDEYLAYTCAMTGGLHEALAAATVDSALLHGAAGILNALANGGPAQDLSDYPHTLAAVDGFLRHAEASPLDLDVLLALDALTQRDEVTPAQKQRSDALRQSPAANALIAQGLESEDRQAFWHANAAARQRGIDTFEQHEKRVKAGQLDLALFHLLQSADESRIERALDAARPHIPLASLATGPSDCMGVGPGFEHHGHVDFIVQELARFPGHGSEYVIAALQSPVIRNRNMALRALAAWSPARWSPALVAALDNALEREPDPDVEATIARVRAGGPFDDPEDGDEPADNEEPADDA